MRYFYHGDAAEDGDRDAADADEQDASSMDEGDEDGPDDTGGGGDDLDAEFPRGDGTADTSAVAYCPYCGELNELAVDPGGGSSQSYVEDCHVCCRPWRVTVAYDREGHAAAYLEAADD